MQNKGARIAVVDIHVAERAHVGRVKGIHCGVDDALKGELDVIGGHLSIAIGKHLAGFQPKRVMGIVQFFKGLRGVGSCAPAAICLESHEVLIDRAADHALGG